MTSENTALWLAPIPPRTWRIHRSKTAQQNDELEQGGACLLPERLLRFAKQVVDDRCDGVRDRVRIEIVVARVVTDVATEPNLGLVGGAPGTRQHAAYLPAEVTLDLEDQPANLALGIACLPPKELVGVRVHARGRFSSANGTDYDHARVEPALRNRQPRLWRAAIRRLEMTFSENQHRCRSLLRRYICRKRPLFGARRSTVGNDGRQRTKD